MKGERVKGSGKRRGLRGKDGGKKKGGLFSKEQERIDKT